MKKIHFVGIKGVGMTPLAIIAKQAGFEVTGSDINEAFITDDALLEAGIEVYKNFSQDHITDQDFVITTGAHGGFFNPEVLAAKAKHIPFMSQGQAVGEFMSGKMFGRIFEGISVAGSHGKTTTCAIIATVLQSAGLKPSYVIGTSSIPTLGLPGHFDNGKYFIAEADEYVSEPKHDKTAKLLWQHPKIAVLTNIELDHPEVYSTLNDVRNMYLQFTRNIPADGLLVACGDDEQISELIKQYTGRVLTYGLLPSNDYVVKNVVVSKLQTTFDLEVKGKSMGKFTISVSGVHNSLNATAAIVVARECGLNLDGIKNSIASFCGSKRRFEYIGKLPSGALFFDDYAHHPTEIRNTLHAFRQSFPSEKIVCIFQPHTYSRTKKLFTEFTHAFSDADLVIITDIYASQREEKDESVSSKHLTLAMHQIQRNILYMPRMENVIEYITQQAFATRAVIITMGAGDIYKIAQELQVKK